MLQVLLFIANTDPSNFCNVHHGVIYQEFLRIVLYTQFIEI